jgi:competence protein ComEC
MDSLPHLPRASSRRPFLVASVLLILGIVLGHEVWCGRLSMLVAAVVTAVLGGALLAAGPKPYGMAAMCLLVVWLGVVVANGYEVRVDRADSLSRLVSEGERCELEGIVLDDPEAKETAGSPWEPPGRVYRFHMRVTSVDAESGRQPAGGRVVVSVKRRGDLGLAYGDRVRLSGVVGEPDPVRNPGGFDYRRYLARRGIRRTVHVGRKDSVERLGSGGNVVWKLAYGLRHRLEASIERGALDEESRAFLTAVLLGKRRAVGEDLEEALLQTNTFHILAISGLHAAIVALALRGFLRRCFVPRSAAAVLTVLVLVVYAGMTGGRASVVRAGVMMSALMLGPLVQRESDGLNSLGFAAVVILLVKPLDVYDAGFQLSFAAAGAIILFVPRVRDWAAERWHLRPEPGVALPRWREWLNSVVLRSVELLALSIAAYLAVAPLTACYFHRFAPLSFIPNVGVVVLIGLIVPLGLVAALLGLASTSAALVAYAVTGVLVDVLDRLVMVTSSVRLIHINVRSAPLFVLGAYYAVLVAAGFAHRASRTTRAALAAALGVVGALAIWSPVVGRPAGAEVVMLDVGTGDSIFVRTRDGRRILVDGGLVRGGDPGRWAIMPFLRSRGYNRIDAIVLTHYDADHYGGLAYVLRHMPVGEFVVRGGPPGPRTAGAKELMRLVEESGVRVVRLEAGDALSWDGKERVVALAPASWLAETTPENNASIVLRIDDGGGVLLAGDIEAAAERSLVEQWPEQLASRVLKVPHHGSSSSSTPGFVDAVGPVVALIPADRWRPGLHPSAVVVDEYEERGVIVLRTDRHGAITVVAGDGPLRAWTMLANEASGAEASGADEAPTERH